MVTELPSFIQRQLNIRQKLKHYDQIPLALQSTHSQISPPVYMTYNAGNYQGIHNCCDLYAFLNSVRSGPAMIENQFQFLFQIWHKIVLKFSLN